MPNRRLLAIFAHPDDETFLAGSLLARYAATGVHVGLVWGGGRLEHDVVVGWVGLPARPHMRLVRGRGAGNCACARRRSRLLATLSTHHASTVVGSERPWLGLGFIHSGRSGPTKRRKDGGYVDLAQRHVTPVGCGSDPAVVEAATLD